MSKRRRGMLAKIITTTAVAPATPQTLSATPAQAASYTPSGISCETYAGYGVMSGEAPIMRSDTGRPQTAYWKAAIFRVSGATVTFVSETHWRVGVVGSNDIFGQAMDGNWYDLQTGAFVGDSVSFTLNQAGYYAVAYYLYLAAPAPDGAARAPSWAGPHPDFPPAQQMGSWWCRF